MLNFMEEAENLTLCASSSAASISPHWDSLLLLLNILQEFESSLQLPSIDSLSRLSRILEADSKIGSSGASRLRRCDFGRSVADLVKDIS